MRDLRSELDDVPGVGPRRRTRCSRASAAWPASPRHARGARPAWSAKAAERCCDILATDRTSEVARPRAFCQRRGPSGLDRFVLDLDGPRDRRWTVGRLPAAHPADVVQFFRFVRSERHLVLFVVLIAVALVSRGGARVDGGQAGGSDGASSRRLSLNPLAHIDLIGTVLFPLIAMLLGRAAARLGEAGAGHPRTCARRGATSPLSRSPVRSATSSWPLVAADHRSATW